MGAMFRSEEMALCQLFIQPEAAYPSISELGESGTVQFRDLNSKVNAFQRKFVSEVRRCDELERKLRYIETELNKDNVPIPDVEEVPKAPNPREIIDLEARLEKTENEIRELNHNAVNLKSNFLELTELRHVLEKAESFFDDQDSKGELGDVSANVLIYDEAAQTTIRERLGFVAGVVPRERVPAFERMLWRISHGNVFLRQADLDEPLEDPATGNEIFKTVFVAFFQGEQLKTRVKKVCTGFHASLYPCPNVPSEQQEMIKGVATRLEDLQLVLDQTKDHRQRVLVNVSKQLQIWMIQVRKMKAIYHTLNMFNMDVTEKCLIAECWAPVEDLPLVRKALSDGGMAADSSIPSFLNVIETSEPPPTFNRTNKFTRGFQNLIDSYSIASYREINPALYTIITFPFLFGVMFGDAGHGIILTICGAYLCIDEKRYLKQKSLPEVFAIFFEGRYIILLMGLFSIYTGIIYNDLFSKSMNIFGSSWKIHYNISTIDSNGALQLSPEEMFIQEPYPLGVDPVWQLSSNKIVFLNSFKMKLSIIFGVVHMIFAVCMSVVNHLKFNPKNIFFDFIPQLIFLVVLFAYMLVMMFMKWIMYGPTNSLAKSPRCAPSVLIFFINMMLFKENTAYKGCDVFMYPGQDIVQKVLVVVALLCIPWLLLAKPIYVVLKRRKTNSGEHPFPTCPEQEMLVCQAPSASSDDGVGNGDVSIKMNETSPSSEKSASPADGGGHGEHENEPLGEMLIYQAIHTIEYVLNTVSHTASYLRLWALSLAHSQLSEVLWNQLFHIGLSFPGYPGSIMIFLLFAVWAFFTVAILVMMEGLSAFLHTLRLHWVEFMSKFYEGLGYAFQPFSFKSILESEEDVEE